jgi:hypothetical protein
VASPGCRFESPAVGALTYPRSNRKKGLRELIALSLLAALGCGLALAHGDLLFVPVFGGAIAMMTNEAIRRLR